MPSPALPQVQPSQVPIDLPSVLAPHRALADETKLQTVKSPLTTTGEQLTSLQDITHYNNFYEFGVQKERAGRERRSLPTRPWTVKVDGKVKQPKTFDIDALLKLRPLEDRVYRHRCVEAWSMVIPWVGYSLSEFIKQCDPLPSAKYVQFLSYYDKQVEKWTSRIHISTGPTPKACAWMKPCTRSRCSPSASTARCCPTRMARPSASLCHGSTVSNRRSRS